MAAVVATGEGAHSARNQPGPTWDHGTSAPGPSWPAARRVCVVAVGVGVVPEVVDVAPPATPWPPELQATTKSPQARADAAVAVRRAAVRGPSMSLLRAAGCGAPD